ncbi:MAG TPA: substrate-binding domain-containing protein [Kofleriaceae bacterium]|jgi:ABC-type phosphate transport system substrate-binding protein
MRAWIVCIALLLTLGDARADDGRVRVIVHKENPATKLSKQFIADAFLKKRTRWGDDAAIQPVDLGARDSVRAKFSKDVLDRDVTAVKRYWAQLVFSGRGIPPPEVASEADAVAYVAKHPGAIAYVSTSVALDGVKAIAVE